MSVHRYEMQTLAGDYLRAATGLAFSGGPLLLLEVAGPVAVVLAGMAGLFAIFGARTAWRQRTVLEITGEAVVLHGPVRREIRWAEVTRCRLDHFTLRRENGAGWMQLRIGSATETIRVESTIAGFNAIAAAAARAAAAGKVELTASTAENFRSLAFDSPAAHLGNSAA